MTDPAGPTRDRGEIAEAIRALTPRDLLRLNKKASVYATLVASMDADDLLQEAFRRALDGERKCPVSVDVSHFLCEAMRSIASGEHSKAARKPIPAPLAGHCYETVKASEPADPQPDAEQLLIKDEQALRRRAEIVALFEDDLVAQTIVEGILDNMRGEELRELSGLDETAYESKRRLIRRRIEKRKGVMP